MTDNTGRFKFAWYYAMAADQRISDAGRLILGYCAVRYVFGEGETFTVKQDVIARHFGVRRQTVGNALKRARDLGWLQSQERIRGRGHTQGDLHQLTFPDEIGTPPRTSNDDEIGTPPQTSNAETGSPPQAYSDETGTSPRTSLGEKDVRGDGEMGAPPRINTFADADKIGARADSLTCEKDPPLVSSGFKTSGSLNTLGSREPSEPETTQEAEPSDPPHRPASRNDQQLPEEPVHVPVHVQVLREHHPASMTVRQVAQFHFQVKEPSTSQLKGARLALNRESSARTGCGLAAFNRDAKGQLKFCALPTTGWKPRRKARAS
jgi:hypothetical protein